MSIRITGKLPSGPQLLALKASPQFKVRGFENLSPTAMKADDVTYWKMLKDFIHKNKNVTPGVALPSVKSNLSSPPMEPAVIWFGHSSYMLWIAGKSILVDPVLSGNAAPLSFMVKAFPGADIYKPVDIPEVDCLVITHDHYDHLDFKTVTAIKDRVKNIVCSKGISSHLTYWGFDPARIKELDWWESTTIDNVLEFTAAPARHFSGRGIKRNQTLWSSFVLKTKNQQVYIGGDSGYDEHFKLIGDKFGPFDLAILECGQYNKMWPLIHMIPEETVQAAKDLKAKVLLPVHWAKFTLALHAWDEPARKIVEAATDANQPIMTPMIGDWAGFEAGGRRWWEEVNS
jgi:L-ascorbate metabolism protein UlaG (beta-lactamase superfamily)